MKIKLFKKGRRCSKCGHKMIYNELLQESFCPFCIPLYAESVKMVESGERPAEIKMPDSLNKKLASELGLTKNINNSKSDFTNGER